MTNASVPNPDFVSGTTISSSEMDANFQALVDFLNSTGVHAYQDGTLTKDDVASALAAHLGVNDGSNVRRGLCSIATEETTTSTSFVELTTPDQVSSIVMPTDGLIAIGYRALWKLTGATNDGSAAIFLNDNQIKSASTNSAPIVRQISLDATGDNYGILTTAGGQGGLACAESASSNSSFTGTGTILQPEPATAGSIVYVYADAGTYDVSIRFAVNVTAGGTLSVKERKLWVWAMGF